MPGTRPGTTRKRYPHTYTVTPGLAPGIHLHFGLVMTLQDRWMDPRGKPRG